MLKGEQWILPLLQSFAGSCKDLRIQINLTARAITGSSILQAEDSAANLVEYFKQLPEVQFILPFQRTLSAVIEKVLTLASDQGVGNIQLFHDPSGGSGTSAATFQDPEQIANFGPEQWIGFTGGVKEETVDEVLTAMHVAAKGHPFWSDMQTNVREASVCARAGKEKPALPRRDRYFGKFDITVANRIAQSISASAIAQHGERKGGVEVVDEA
jgi:hypothetical protein